MAEFSKQYQITIEYILKRISSDQFILTVTKMGDSNLGSEDDSFLSNVKALNQINVVGINIGEYYKTLSPGKLKSITRNEILLKLLVNTDNFDKLSAIYEKMFNDKQNHVFHSLELTLILILKFTAIHRHHYAYIMDHIFGNESYELSGLLKDFNTGGYLDLMKEDLFNITQIKWENWLIHHF